MPHLLNTIQVGILSPVTIQKKRMCYHALLAWQDACYREDVSALHGPEEDHSHDRHVGSIHNAGGKYLIQLPAIRVGGRFYSALCDSHDCA